MGKVDDDTVSNGQLKRDNQCLGEGEGEGEVFPNKKHDKEVSTDDVRSEVSNPPLTLASPKQASQDITSQPQPQPHPQPQPQPQPECGEVTSACHSHSHSHSDSDQSDRGVVTSRFVVEIPEYAATSGIRKITFKFSKPKDHSQPHSYDHSSLSPMLDAFLDFPGAASPPPPPPHSDFKRSNKVPTNVKKLLSTGILDGARVKYVYGSSKLDGIISGGGYLCSCSSCNFSRVLSAYEFEQHAGAKTRHPNNHIYLDNGRPIYSIIQQLKTAPLGILDQLINDLLGSSVNHDYLRLWKETLHENDRLAQVAKRHHKNLPRLSHPVVSCSIPAFEESVTSASYPLGQSNFWQQTFMETTGEPKRIMTKSSSFVSNSAVQHKKTPEGGGTKRRDNDLHRLLFMPNGLPDGAELAYFVKGQRMLGGYKQGNGIVCNCCNEEVSPSQFESHAGMAARRQPYRHIYTTNGLTLHDIAISLANGQNLTTGDSDDMCAVCGDGGDLVLCHGCPRAFHAACLDLPCVPQQEWHCPNCKDRSDHARKTAAGELLSPSRPFVIRLTRVVKAPEMEIGGCVVCRGHDFSAAKFDERTVMLCDQCEREFHVGCLRESGLCDLKELPKDKWFCCDDCSRIHLALQNSVSVGAEIIPASLSNMIFKKHADKGLYLKGEAADLQWRILSGKSRCSEHLPFLSRSAAIFRECFDPIVAKSGRDLIPVMVYGRNISGQEFGGMYCVVLIVRSVVVSAGLLRVFGREVAELPLVATSREYQGKGYFQALFWCIERLLASLNVENIVLPAAEEAESIWTNKFGFTKMSEERVAKYMREVQFTIFKGTSMLEKAVQHSR